MSDAAPGIERGTWGTCEQRSMMRKMDSPELRRCVRNRCSCWIGCRWIACVALLHAAAGIAAAADVTFNITYLGESNPIPPVAPSNFSYADIWAENGFAYVGSDRTGQGVAIFSISNPANPIHLTTYPGSEMEDVEVWDGIGYFGSDVNASTGRQGVDIVDLSIPFDPIRISRVDSTIGAHNKVHTLSVYNGFMYTSDNETDVIKITNVSDPAHPVLAKSLDLGAPSGVASHEVYVRNDRMYVASKRNDTTGLSCCGWTHIYDVANPANPVLLKAFLSGPRSHTALPSDDGKLLVVAEERPDGDVHIYDISMINEPNDPDDPIKLSTFDKTSVGIDAHSPHHPHLHGNLLFLTWYEAGLQVFNIADPSNPVHVGAFDTWPGTSTNFNGNWGVDLSLGLKNVFLSDRKRGIIAVDASGVLLPGDYNQDMVVDQEDYLVWQESLGTSSSGLHIAAFADGNYDGIVDAADYTIWRDNLGRTWDTSPGAAAMALYAAVPEPAAGTLLALASLLVAARRVRLRTDSRE